MEDPEKFGCRGYECGGRAIVRIPVLTEFLVQFLRREIVGTLTTA